MRAIHRNQQGFALATAILALVVVGALVTAGFFAASQEGRVGTSNAQADLAFYIAEQGLQNTLGSVKRRQVRNLTPGETLSRSGTVAIGTRTVGNYAVTIRPFGGEFYLVESLGTVTQGGRYAGAQRRVGTVVRTMELHFPLTAALTTYGGITLRGAATVSGTDREPNQWADTLCDDPLPTESGIRTRPEAEVSLIGGPRVTGDPPIEYDAELDTAEFSDFGDVELEELTGMASHTLGLSLFTPNPTVVGTACQTSNPQNWGEVDTPGHPCFNYFPVIHVEGGLTVAGNGEGQGILIVCPGDLTVSGNFRYYGIVIVCGRFNNNLGSGNAQIHGTLLTKNNADVTDDSEFRGTPVLQFSTCSAERAIQENDALARLFPVQKRSWIDLTAAGVED